MNVFFKQKIKKGEKMKYYPFASLEVAKFKSLLKFAQRLGAISIIGFYVTLLIAAGVYFASSANATASLQANQILTIGLIVSGCSLALSGIIALFVSTHSVEKQAV